MDNQIKQLKGKLIFGKFKILEFISKGSFGGIFLAKNIQTEKLYAVKAENKYFKNQILRSETFILYNLKGLGIPSVISYGFFGQYNILVQTLLGKSIERIRKENNNKLNLKDVCMIAIQTLERIEFIHSKNYIHRDIKPQNFLVGYPDSYLIYLIDFGNSRKYRSSRTGKHITNNKKNKIFGTVLFLSINVFKGYEQSRKDDLESLGYMYIYLTTGYLPWSSIKYKNPEEMIDKTRQLKQNTSLEELCKDMPKEIFIYMKYVRELKFEEKPDYLFLRKLFMLILFKNGLKYDNSFSWVKNKITNNISQKQIRPRSNPQKRLMKKLVDSHSKKLIESLSSYDNQKNSNLINNKKPNQNNIIPIHQTLLSIQGRGKINGEKKEKGQIIYRNIIKNKINNNQKGNIDKRNNNKDIKSDLPNNENNINKSKVNNFNQINISDKKYQKKQIKKIALKKTAFNDNIIFNINNYKPKYFYNKTQSNSESNINDNDKYLISFRNNIMKYNTDWRDSKINSFRAYNNSQIISKIPFKQYSSKNHTIQSGFNNINYRIKNNHSPIVQYIYKPKQNKNYSSNNEILDERVGNKQELKTKILGKNNIIKNSFNGKNNTIFIKKPNYTIKKMNQRVKLYNIENNNKNQNMNFYSEMKTNTEGLYQNLVEKKKLFQTNMEVNPNYNSFNYFNKNIKLKA